MSKERIPLFLIEKTQTGLNHARKILGRQFEVTNFPHTPFAEVEKLIATGNLPGVIVTNLAIGESADPECGVEFIKKLRKHLPSSVIVVWTKHSQVYRTKALMAGANRAFAKYAGDDTIATEIIALLK